MRRKIASRGRQGLLIPALLLGIAMAFSLNPSCDSQPISAATAVNGLRRMVQAEENLSYEGMRRMSTVWGSDGEDDERRHDSFYLVTHQAGGRTRMEGAGLPAGRVRRWTQSGTRFSWLRDVDLLLRNYTVEEAGTETVVGRAGQVLRVRSIHPGRPSARLVVDAQTGLLLVSEFWDYRGALTLESRFDTLLLDAEIKVGESKRRWNRRPEREKTQDTALAFVAFEPQFLPEGFESVRSHRTGRRRPGVSHLYSDGLSWIEITQNAAEPDAEERVVTQRRIGSRITMSMVHDGVAVRLVGRLDPVVLIKVLESLGTPRPN